MLPTVPPQPQLLTPADLCKILRITRTTLWRWRVKGEFPDALLMPGHQPRWTPGAIEAWLAKQPRVA